jgi:glycosyltransferase involved in cell wall biosynthesis
MKRVLIRGPVLTQSGYGVHSRQIAKWLLSRDDCDVSVIPAPWGITTWYLDSNACDGLIGELMSRTIESLNAPREYDVSFQIQLPNEWDVNLAKFNVGVTAGIETDICNPQWIQHLNKMDLVIVPSTHARDVFMRTSSMITTPIIVVPESYITAIDDALDSGADTNSLVVDMGITTSFNFLLFGQVTGDNPESDRKNTFYAVKWLCETFADDKDVGVIIKTNMGRSSEIDKQRTTEMFTRLVHETRKGKYPKFYLIHGQLNDEEVTALYTDERVKAAVSLTRGEGYGLPLVEAAAAGLPVIATNWSGHIDFLGKGKFIKLDYKLKQIHQSRVDNVLFMPDAKWAEVDEHDVKRKLKKFRNATRIPQGWADELSLTVRKEFSFDAVARRYDEIFDKLES